jgi:Tol biopolymer transport system component
VDGSGQARALVTSDLPKIPDDWSQDGKFLVYEVTDPKTGDDLWILPMSGIAKPFPFSATEHSERNARFSPDGKWIAYTSDESGQLDVYIQAFGNHGGKWRVSSNGGRMPSWSKDGKDLFYVTGETQFMSVPIESEPAFKIGTPVPMFQIQMAETGITAENRTEYAISVDGNRFLINKKIEEEVSTPITIITNWTLNLPR